MSKKLIIFLAIVLAPLWLHGTAKAHVLVPDTSHKVGAVLHVDPDDDPVAGQPSTLIFDIQQLKLSDYTASLTITESGQAPASVPAAVSGSAITASYTFPMQDRYLADLTLTPKAGSPATVHKYTFQAAQRVARGTVGSALDRPSFAWAETTLAVCGAFALVLGIIGVNRRRDIIAHAVWPPHK